MSDISAKAVVHCSVNQAERQLARYFREFGNEDGSVARLTLRADSPSLGGKSFAFERPAIATISSTRQPGDMLPSYAVSWAAEGGGPYPTFVGSLRIGPMDDYDSFELVLDGRYEPPLGLLGAGFDLIVGHRLAESMASHLVHAIGQSIEAAFAADEAAKQTKSAR